MIRPIIRKNISDIVFTEMLDMIVSGQWKLGTKIPSENVLKDQFQISRNSVRQIIHRLSALGLLESRQGEGTFVKKVDSSFYLNVIIPSVFLGANNTLKIIEYQKSIQIECVKLACSRCTNEQVDQLFQLIQNMRDYSTVHEKYLENDIAYHVLIADMTFNELFIKSMEVLRLLLFHSLKKIVDKYDSSVSIDFHDRIARAVQARDSVSAARLMEDHMVDVISKLSNIMQDEDKNKVVPM